MTFRKPCALAAALSLAFASQLGAIPDLRFDVVTFCCNCSGQMLCQPQFDHLNFPSLNGHYLAMGSDAYRTNLLANGNLLAIYYNDFDSDYGTNTAAQEAAVIDQYATSLFTSTGPKPNWVVLNEISSGLWPSSQTYRSWVEGVVHLLRATYGYTVMVYAPFANPGNNAADWQAIAADADVAVENYLSGQAIQSEGFSVGWCEGVYGSSISSYAAVGVPVSQLILGEHFAQTTSGTGYGRAGVSSNSWDSAINARSQAALDLGFAGYIGYAWGGDAMGTPQNEMIHYEDTYAANPLPNSGALTAPFPAQQPQNQIAPPGATVIFNVYPAGDAPTTYQWRFNGNFLQGGTASALTLSNIGPTNAGTYSVLLSNAVGSTWSSNATLTVQVPPPIAFDPFGYSIGAPLIGQSNSQNQAWVQAGPNSGLNNQPTIQSGSLDVSGLAFSSSNSVAFGGGGGMAARFDPFTNGANAASGTIYYSFALKLTNLTGLSSSGVFWAGFNNSAGSQTTTPTAVGTRIYTRAATGGFNLGLSKASSTSTDWQWDTTVHKVNETIFLGGSYTFNTNTTNDDVSQLWINPAASAFGTANPPAATLTANSGADINSSVIASFVIMNRDSAEPAGGIMDELRIGSSWASVTPPSGALPTLSITPGAGGVTLYWPTNAVGFNLFSSTNLVKTNGWTNVTLPVYTVGGYFTVTNTFPPGTEYFRLQHP